MKAASFHFEHWSGNDLSSSPRDDVPPPSPDTQSLCFRKRADVNAGCARKGLFQLAIFLLLKVHVSLSIFGGVNKRVVKPPVGACR